MAVACHEPSPALKHDMGVTMPTKESTPARAADDLALVQDDFARLKATIDMLDPVQDMQITEDLHLVMIHIFVRALGTY